MSCTLSTSVVANIRNKQYFYYSPSILKWQIKRRQKGRFNLTRNFYEMDLQSRLGRNNTI
uniref:Ovule protein n=1 Tax=Romanomermis culicivorax TaxID=13658 RepID=A0A915JDG1_ROMCU